MTDFDETRAAERLKQLRHHMPSEPELRVKALETLLVRKGLISPDTIEAWTQAYRDEIGPHRGADLVARAWVDADFKARLFEDATAFLRAFGYEGQESCHLRVVENTERVHNVIVCTLCSCYPWAVLGVPPDWYKQAAYRARVVRDPRGVLREFGVDLSPDVEIRVWDSTAELRYLVLPQRPRGTDGWTHERLRALVTRNAMIGTQRDLSPETATRGTGP
ncbi:nitrile hydratase subunit alpha [Roseovarius salis]|uniref:nitrile hydratase subunit alpha n=1 Tax=Roseovarius salis TaxID=3376063 RepID=UPI0037C88946